MTEPNRVAVHTVMDHVRGNLDGDLSLRALADVAGFSPSHFHRMFKAETGETAAEFTRRARLERAVDLMRGAPGRSLASIGAEVGFATPSEFSRVFKSLFGVSPSRWDRRSRFGPATTFSTLADEMETSWSSSGDGAAFHGRLVRRPAYEVASIRVEDPWVGSNLAVGYQRLRSWADEFGLGWDGATLVGMSWESGTATALDRLVYDLGMAMPVTARFGADAMVAAVGQQAEPGFPIGLRTLPAVTAVEVHCKSLRQSGLAWEYLFRSWLPGSGFEPADHPAVKFFSAVPDRLDRAAWHVDCSLAVQRALIDNGGRTHR